MDFEQFDTVVVPFPFTDRAATKRRPALVVSTGAFNRLHDHLILAMITTAGNSRWKSDCEVLDWEEARLMHPCRIRLKCFTLPKSLVSRKLGSLSERDRTSAGRALNESLGR
ncbi:type II toxin-antitoxin system PemK/MazF family toxin [Chlorobium sp. N1]|uniref:type II toxin-antitoxin system PemK/MazF family toxin n=1 Tax=Chlorobium sp. N1 TaxID=2491138 RepID=UPI00103BA4B7|nr:type II toxin-antitoxin system PemK/MazF family toxin [Chlorobium sp. N1]TCD47492.1 type II toxin-antitoxin system PemK/MazF family toxin [Chlorobium sp. N1]